METRRVKCVVVGDGAVGKTSLLISYTENRFPEEYVPTVFENFILTVDIDNIQVNASLWDTAGQEELAGLRSLSYPDTDIFVLCFSVADESSLISAEEKWFPEITEYCPTAKVIIVGTKIDLRDDKELLKTARLATPEKANRFANSIGAVGYLECSAKSQIGVKEVFELAVRGALRKQKEQEESANATNIQPTPRSKKDKKHKKEDKDKEKDKDDHKDDHKKRCQFTPCFYELFGLFVIFIIFEYGTRRN